MVESFGLMMHRNDAWPATRVAALQSNRRAFTPPSARNSVLFFEKSPGTDGRTKASAPGLRSRDGADPEAGLDMGKIAHVTSLADPARLVKHDGIVQPPT
jgi:hypothetical protein